MRKKSASNNGKGQMAPSVERSRGNPDMAPYGDPGETRPNAGIQTAGNKTTKKSKKLPESVPGQPF